MLEALNRPDLLKPLFDFVFYYPLTMAWLWITGGLFYYWHYPESVELVIGWGYVRCFVLVLCFGLSGQEVGGWFPAFFSAVCGTCGAQIRCALPDLVRPGRDRACRGRWARQAAWGIGWRGGGERAAQGEAARSNRSCSVQNTRA